MSALVSVCMRVHVCACGSPKGVTLGKNECVLKSVCLCVRRACFGFVKLRVSVLNCETEDICVCVLYD